MFCDEHGTADYCGECVYGPEIETLQQQLAASRSEARKLRDELARVRDLVSGMREYADSCVHPSEVSKRNAVEYWLAQLEDVLPQAAEREGLPLMARREWMRRDTDYFVVHDDFCLEVKALNGRAPYYDESGELVVCAEAGDSIERDQVDAEAQPDGIYRIADTDEHGLPVVERTADMPEDVTHMTLHTRRLFRAGELRARSVEGDEGLVRIEDYRPAAEQPAAPAPDLPLMARRPWHKDDDLGELYENGKRLCTISGEPPLREPMPGFVLYRIADTDEHGLPVIERTADMPEGARYRWPTYGGFAYSVVFAPWMRLSSEVVRIEDYRESGQEGKK